MIKDRIMADKKETWVYKIDSKSPAGVRYILGEKFDETQQKALVCIGINPSTAVKSQVGPLIEGKAFTERFCRCFFPFG